MKFILMIVLSLQLFAEVILTSDKQDAKSNAQVVCIGGHKFAITTTSDGVAMQQIMQRGFDMSYVPQPIKCKGRK